MATLRKILGQANPAAATDGVLYTVPASTDSLISSIVVCETNGVATTIRISMKAVVGTTTTAATAIAWDMSIAANSTVVIAVGATIQAAGGLVVRSVSGNVTFTASGQENT